MTKPICCPTCHRSLVTPGEQADGPGWRIWLGRSEEILHNVDTRSVDMVCTDPPYNSGGDTRASRMRGTGSKYMASESSYQSTLPDFDGDAIQPDAWTAMMRAVWAECARVLTVDGVWCCFVDWRQAPFLWGIIERAGLRVRGMVPWDKGLSARPLRGGFRNQCEYVLWGSRGGGRLPRTDIYLPGVLRCTSMTGGKVHQTQKPESVIADLLEICREGGLVLDPFAGSGTTLIAAVRGGRRALGIESKPEIWSTARDRIMRECAHVAPDDAGARGAP